MRFTVDCRAKEPCTIKTGTILGHQYTYTDEYLFKDGKPYIYTMGELHFSRMKEEDWETELVKMKAGGIEIVSSYIFWNHHETEKGKFDFSGNRNLRKFINICAKLDMPFFLRLGPWAHGEARLGGFPDWLVDECPSTRSMDENYLFYVRRLFTKIYEQVKDCQNIIGIQIENEYSGGPEYLRYLYDMAKEIGFDALIFSATGWDNATLPECLQPMFGVYPEHPWVQNTKLYSCGNAYGFFKHDADLYWERTNNETRRYPVFTCELGGGNQSTYRRRPLIMPWEVASLTVIQLGTGCKGLGYYMYHGGINPVVTDSDRIVATFQENRQRKYASDCPVISYDFQSPLGDCGQYRQSYYELKTLLGFVKCEERNLAPMQTFRDIDAPDFQDMIPLRAGIQSNGRNGYLFYVNCYHGHRLNGKTDTAHIQLEDGEISIPLSVPENGFGIIPFNYKIGSETLKWIKAIPVEKSENSVTFSLISDTEPEFMDENGKTGNLRNVQSIGGLKVILTETEHPVQIRDKALTVVGTENRLSFDIFSHIIPKFGLKLDDLTREYTVDIPEGTQYVSVTAEGNVGAAFEEISGNSFRLISDHYIDGDEWIVDVRNVRKLRLKIQPLCESDREIIYMEKAFVYGHFLPKVYALGEEITLGTPQSTINIYHEE